MQFVQSYRALLRQHFLIIVLLLTIGAVVLSTLFFSRSFVFYPQDTAHLQDLYYHSQWTIPLSIRSISDNQLYYVAAVELAQGAHPFSINPEVPPAGKYLYSLGYLFFGNPFVMSAILYFAVVILTYAVARALLANRVQSLLAAFAMSISPAISSQVAQTMLDLPLMFFLLLHVWALFSLQRQNKRWRWLWVVLAGIALGGFAGTKFPLFAPVVVLADLFFFWKAKKVLQGIVMFVVAGMTFMLLYTAYFFAGHSLIDWARSLYWTVQFYLIGGSAHPYLQVFPGVLFGTHLERAVGADVTSAGEVVSGAASQWAQVREWSLVWPAALLGLFSSIWMWLRRKNALHIEQQFVVVLAVVMIALLSIVDFKARYFFPLLPLLAVLGFSVISFRSRVAKVGLVVFSLILVAQFFAFWHTPPTEIVKEVNRTWNAGNYQDLYSFVLPGSAGVDRKRFHEILARQFDQNLGLESREIAVSVASAGFGSLFTGSKLPGELAFVLTSPELTLEGTQPVSWQKYNGEWYLVWDWSWYLAEFAPECEVKLAYGDATGALTSRDGVVLSQFEEVAYLRLHTEGLGSDDATIESLRPLFNTEFARAQVFAQNEIVGREWFDFSLKISDLTPEQLVVIPDRQEEWMQLERRTNPRFSEVQQAVVSQLEAENPEVRGTPAMTISMQCPDGEKEISQSGTRKNVQLEDTLAEIFSAVQPE